MKIYVKTLTGHTITLDAEPFDTILKIKEQILNNQGTPIDQQIIIFAGQKLTDNERLLSGYNIQSESTIHMVVCLRKPIILFYGF